MTRRDRFRHQRLPSTDARYERVEACEVCDSQPSSHALLFWKYGTPVVRCSVCSLVFASPRWTSEHLFKRYRDPEYWTHYAETIRATAFDPVANQARWDPSLELFAAERGEGRLLDVGCATGEFLAAAKARGWQAHGVEASEIAAAHARESHGVDVHTGTLEDVRFPDASFDVVTMWDVIEHLQHPRAVVERVARLLRPGGLLGLTTPNIGSLRYYVQGRRWWVVGPNEHIFYFSPATVDRLLRRCGFDVTHIDTFGPHVGGHGWPRVFRPVAGAARRALRAATRRGLLGDELQVVARRMN